MIALRSSSASPSSLLLAGLCSTLGSVPIEAQTQTQKILPSVTGYFAEFGATMDIDGDVAVIGAPGESINGLNYAGAAYIFRRGPGGWVEEARLTALVPEIHDDFATSVSISGDVCVVGAPDFPYSSFTGTGRVWVFRNNAGLWSMEAELVGSSITTDDAFGREVSVEGSTILARGSSLNSSPVFVFDYDGSMWNETAALTNPSPFSGDILLNGGLAFLAATNENVGTKLGAGAVHIYRRTGNVWTEEALVTDPQPEDYAAFGTTLAQDADVLLVGDATDNNVFVYRQQGTLWPHEDSLKMPLPSPISLFGQSLAVSADIALVGASNMNNPLASSGGVFIYRWDGSNWVNEVPFSPLDIKANQGFGVALALDGVTALVGTYDNVNGVGAAGSAYEFDVTDLHNGFRMAFNPMPPQANEDLTIEALGGSPMTPLFAVVSTIGLGSLYIAPLQVTLDLSNPMLFGALLTDNNGDATWNLVPDASIVGVTFWFQSLQKGLSTPVVGMTGSF